MVKPLANKQSRNDFNWEQLAAEDASKNATIPLTHQTPPVGKAPFETTEQNLAQDFTAAPAEDRQMTRVAPGQTPDSPAVQTEIDPNSVERLLQLAAEAEQLARLTEDAAETAGQLAQQLLQNMAQQGIPEDESLRQLSFSAGENAIIASEAAVKAQMGAMEAHAAAVNQSLAELEYEKEALQRYSQEYIQLSKLAAQAENEALRARETVNRTRLEHSARQNAASSHRETLSQTKKEYELQLARVKQAQANLDLAQQKAKKSHLDFLELQKKQRLRRQVWQELKSLQASEQVDFIQAARDERYEPYIPPISTTTLPTPEQEEKPIAAQSQAAPTAAARSTAQPQRPPAYTEPDFSALADSDHVAAEINAAIDVEKASENRIRSKKLWRYGAVLAIVVAITVLINIFVIQFVTVSGISMSPTLTPGEIIVSNKLTYLFREPQRGDIIMLYAPGTDELYVKRIIGLPNEQIDFIDGKVYIDGVELDESLYLDGVITERGTNTVVPSDAYFVLGDNRPASRDSRAIGTIPFDRIDGKAVFRIFPFTNMNGFPALEY